MIDAIPQIVERVPQAKFLFVGSGELEEQFKKRVHQQGVGKRVIFVGLVEQKRIPSLISVMDVVAHTSLFEGLARVLPQAFAAQKPVVSFDIDGAHEIITNDRTGYLVQPGNHEQLVAAIVALLTDNKKRLLFGENGFAIVRSKWSVEKMVENIDIEYRKLLANHRRHETQ